MFQNNRPSGVNPRAIAVDNNTVILQSASSGGQQSIPSTVIVQAPPSTGGTQVVVPAATPTASTVTPSSVSAAVSSPSVISRLSSGDSISNQETVATGLASNSHIPVSVIPSPSFLKRKTDQTTPSNDSKESEPLDKKPRVATEGEGDIASNHHQNSGETSGTNVKHEEPDQQEFS